MHPSDILSLLQLIKHIRVQSSLPNQAVLHILMSVSHRFSQTHELGINPARGFRGQFVRKNQGSDWNRVVKVLFFLHELCI